MPSSKPPKDNVTNITKHEQADQGVEVSYILDTDTTEAAKKLKKRTFEKLLSKDLEIIRSHNTIHSKEE